MFVAVSPHPPLLVDDFDPNRQPELTDVRAAALDVVGDLLAERPSVVTVVAAQVTGEHDESAGGSLGGLGVQVRAGGATDVLPPDATVGAWLLDVAGWTGARRYVGVDRWGADDEAVLVMADGTFCRTDRAPGHFDPRSEGLDAVVAAALAAGDAASLTGLDLRLADELGMSGARALVALGDAVSVRTTRGADVVARLRYDAAPLGVGYWVADWRIG